MSGNSLPVLLTCDIHTHTYKPSLVHEDLSYARRDLAALHLPCTFFFPAISAEALHDDVRALQAEGHEIGCHGLTHDAAEQYSTLPRETQRHLLTEATARIAAVTGERPLSFRAPTFKISGATIGVLEELGYAADLSVVSQRLGLFGSDIYSWVSMGAPRRPYRPSTNNVFRRGHARIWEIPVSALLLPFISNTERLCGRRMMELFFRALALEWRATGKPIVFMFHAEDFNHTRPPERLPRLSWRHFVPSSRYGFQFRYFLMEGDWANVRRDLVALLEHMAASPRVRFLTVREYLQSLDGRQRLSATGSSATMLRHSG